MSEFGLVLLAITAIFALLVSLKQHLSMHRIKYCAICLAVSLTWLSLLLLGFAGIFQNNLITAILMGQSSLGLYYLFEKKSPERLHVFRLPLLLTLTLLVYLVLAKTLLVDALLIVTVTWLLTGTLYLYSTKPLFEKKVKALIECCRDW